MQAQERARQLDIYGSYMSALVKSDRRGIITLNKIERILHINKTARKLIWLSDTSVGKEIDVYIVPPCP